MRGERRCCCGDGGEEEREWEGVISERGMGVMGLERERELMEEERNLGELMGRERERKMWTN